MICVCIGANCPSDHRVAGSHMPHMPARFLPSAWAADCDDMGDYNVQCVAIVIPQLGDEIQEIV